MKKKSKGLCHFGKTETNLETSAANFHKEEFLFTAQPYSQSQMYSC